jgi:TolC family type I secretion outer membrane protein
VETLSIHGLKMSKKVLLIFFLLLSGVCDLPAAAAIRPGDVLTLQQCIDIAWANHPAISAAAGAIRQSDSRIGQARSGYYPQIAFKSGYSWNAPVSSAQITDQYNYYSNALSLNQTLFDFGKTAAAVDIQKLAKQSAEADYQDTAALLVLNVQAAFYALHKAKMSRTVAQETLKQFQEHFEIARTFFETGKSSKIDVTSAEVNLTNARIQLISAQNSLRVARANLNKAMGLSAAPDYDIREEFALAPESLDLESALARAYENRPDYLSLKLKREALERSVDLNKKDYLPVLSGNANYGYSGTDTSIGRSWTVGVTLTFPLFTGLSTKYAVDEARAALDIAAANEESLRQKIFLEVQTAYLNRHEAFERIEASRMIVRQAEETLELASGRYATGVGSSIEITDAMIKLNNAKMTYISALSDFKVAEAELEKAMGVKR